ncbi:MAG: hypothetical protein KJN96_03290 [Eudoraea sp.]|nr:hypothetical protein [Eudoraea sp.]
MVGWIIAGLLLLILLYLLFAPLVLYLNTDEQAYFVQLKGLAKASIEGDKREFLKIRLDTLFSHFYFYPLRRKKVKKADQKKEKAQQKKSLTKIDQRKINRYARIGRGLLRSFELKRLEVALDTGDCIQNAKLFPVFAFLDFYVGDFNINFQNHNRVVLHLQNRAVNIIKVFINP